MHVVIAIFGNIGVQFLARNLKSNSSLHFCTHFVRQTAVLTLVFWKIMYSYISNAVHKSISSSKILPVLHFPSNLQFSLHSFHPSPLYPPLSLRLFSPPWLLSSKTVSPLTTHSPFIPARHPPTWPHLPFHLASLGAQQPRHCCRARASTPENSSPASHSYQFTHPDLLHASTTFLSGFFEFSPDRNAFASPAALPPHKRIICRHFECAPFSAGLSTRS